MSQMDNAITAIKQLFDKDNRGERLCESKRNKELFQAARAFYNAIAHFERSASPKSLDAKGRTSAADSITGHAKDGREFVVPVTYKSKKKKMPSQKTGGIAKKSSSINAATAKKKGVKCARCGQAFSIYHVCPPPPRQPTYTDIKPPTPVKPKSREKDETKRPRTPPFDKGISGSTIRATKLAGATKQDGKRSVTTHAKRFNARLKKGR